MQQKKQCNAMRTWSFKKKKYRKITRVTYQVKRIYSYFFNNITKLKLYVAERNALKKGSNINSSKLLKK